MRTLQPTVMPCPAQAGEEDAQRSAEYQSAYRPDHRLALNASRHTHQATNMPAMYTHSPISPPGGRDSIACFDWQRLYDALDSHVGCGLQLQQLGCLRPHAPGDSLCSR